MPEISIITPTYNGFHIFKQCLDSLRSHCIDIPWEWIIMDNGDDSTSGYIERLKDRRIKVIKGKNIGNYSTMNNELVSLSTGKYLLFLNNDVQFNSNILKQLLSTYTLESSIGAVGCKLFYPDGKLQHAGVVFKEKFRPINISIHLNVDYPNTLYTNIMEFDAVTGACLFISKDDFLNVGGFGEHYNWGYEDVDLCLKIKHMLNKKIICDNTISATHYGSYTVTSKNNNVETNLAKFLNQWQDKISINHIEHLNSIPAFYKRDM